MGKCMDKGLSLSLCFGLEAEESTLTPHHKLMVGSQSDARS